MLEFRKLSLVAVLSAAAVVVACGDDDNLVRTRSDGGVDASTDGPTEAGPNTLSCGVTIPSTYESPSFAANAAAEIALKESVLALGAKMKSAEGATPAVVTTTDLQLIFTGGAPSLHAIATAFGQSTVDAYLSQFGDAAKKTWTPADAEADGGTTSGGKYDNGSIFSPTGIDLREATEKVLLTASLYNYALVLASGPITEATIDRLLAVYGASTKLAGRTDADAGDAADELVAEYASRRDNKASSTPGPYRKIRSSLLVAKAAASNTAKCRADLDAALKIYFLEWEKASYLTVIYYLNQAATNALVTPATAAKGAAALHAYGEALGFAQSFKGIPQDRRKITDLQIDALLQRIGAATPYQLVTRPTERAVAFNTAFQDIGAIYGLTQTEIEDAKKAY